MYQPNTGCLAIWLRGFAIRSDFSQPHHTELHYRDLALESGQSGCPRKFKFFTELWKLLEDFLP